MSTEQDLDEYFYYDDSDDTFLVQAWFTREEKEHFIRFCLEHGTNPSEVIFQGINAIMRATMSPNGYTMQAGLPNPN